MIVGQPESAYVEFAQTFDLNLNFASDQTNLFENQKPVSLTHAQMDDLVKQISSREGISEFLMENVERIPPVYMSLFVLNNALWKMMERKQWEVNKMLAMSTIPYCFWDQKEESTSNLKAVKRWELGTNGMAFKASPPTISIAGNGGDFRGFIEQSHITSRKFGLPESRKLIPNYKFMRLNVTADLSKADVRIHPAPREDLDYDFSMSAKHFHTHGVHITMPGKDVTLTVEKQKPSRLKGEVHLLIAPAFEDETEHFRALMADFWFWAFQRLVEAVR
jgi:hypothetical protein